MWAFNKHKPVSFVEFVCIFEGFVVVISEHLVVRVRLCVPMCGTCAMRRCL